MSVKRSEERLERKLERLNNTNRNFATIKNMEKASKNKLRIHRKKRIRAKIKGTAQKPRLCIFKSLKGMYVQVIDDTKGVTLAQADSKAAKAKNDINGAKKIGETIAKKCKEIKILAVVFDRAGYKYHGKVKALADGAREGGLKF